LGLKGFLIFAIVLLVGVFVFTYWRAGVREAQIAEDHPPVGRIAIVDGVPVHFVQMGEGPDVVLLHGAGGNLREFTFALAPALADRYRVTVFDRPGLGYTGHTDPRYAGAFTSAADSPQEQATLLRAASNQLGLEQPVLVGHSFGGAIAFAWATAHSDEVAGVVSLAGVAMTWEGEVRPYYRVNGSAWGGGVISQFVTAYVSDEVVRNSIGSIFEPDPVPEGYAEHIGGPLAIRRDTFRSNARQVAGLKPHMAEIVPVYPELDLPVAFVHGDQDETIRIDVHTAPAAALLPNATVTILEGVGHMPHHADPAAVITAIDDVAARAGLH